MGIFLMKQGGNKINYVIKVTFFLLSNSITDF